MIINMRRFLWAIPIPIDNDIVASHPDIFLQNKEKRRAEKLSKYDDLCTDLIRWLPGYLLNTVPEMIGALGTVTQQLVSGLGCLPTVEKTELQIKGMQHSMLFFYVRTLRGHLAVFELAA